MAGVIALVCYFIALIIMLLVAVLSNTGKRARRAKIKKEIYSGSFIYYRDFEKYWISMPGRGKYSYRDGLKYHDGSGCYVITIYSKPVKDGNWKKYENVYVGQSVRVYQRVHNHFNGKGNGDVYADIKYGKWVYVSFVRCEEYELNYKETELISLFDATKSYNKTRGGSAIREQAIPEEIEVSVEYQPRNRGLSRRGGCMKKLLKTLLVIVFFPVAIVLYTLWLIATDKKR